MEILLFDNKWFKVERFTAGDTLLKMKINIASHNSKLVKNVLLHGDYMKSVIGASNDYLERTQRSLCIHIKKNPANFGDENKCLVRVHGFLWENLNTLPVEGVKLRLHLCFYPRVHDPIHPAQLSTDIQITSSLSSKTGIVDQTNEGCIKNEHFSEANNVTFYRKILFASDPDIRKDADFFGWATISLFSDNELLTIGDNAKSEILDGDKMEAIRINRKILENKIHCNVAIATSDGTCFPCNKVFLAAHSPVLATMLENEMKESKSGVIEMPDVTPDGVKALLDYVYTCDLEKAMERCDIALELLQIGHKYGMQTLEGKVSSIFLKQDLDWYDIDSAFSLFIFSNKVDSMEEIRMKSASFLWAKRKELKESESYRKLVEESPIQAGNAIHELFFLRG